MTKGRVRSTFGVSLEEVIYHFWSTQGKICFFLPIKRLLLYFFRSPSVIGQRCGVSGAAVFWKRKRFYSASCVQKYILHPFGNPNQRPLCRSLLLLHLALPGASLWSQRTPFKGHNLFPVVSGSYPDLFFLGTIPAVEASSTENIVFSSHFVD
jgi:hypothetical protein